MTVRLKIISIIILPGLTFISCNKEKNNPIDLREQFVGAYQVRETINCYGPCWTCSSEKDTVILVSYGMTDTSLSVLGRDVSLDPSGRYLGYHYSLRIWNDSLYSSYMNGGLGCGQYEIYEGRKIQ